jgi:VIT1/CCC1 family predicted Fe2+/Mn2+ transporter
MDETHAQVNPGWYPDQRAPGILRFWDGERWTDNVAPMAPVAPVATHSPRNDNGMETAGWICAFLLPIIGVILGIILAARGNGKGAWILVVSIVVMVVLYGALSSQSATYY